MRIRYGVACMAAATLGFFPGLVAAQETAVHAFFSNGVRAVIDQLRPQAEQAIGHPLEIQYGTTMSLQRRIEAGEAFDVTILTEEAITDLLKAGKLVNESRVELARCGIGMGMRAGGRAPDIRTTAALKQTLRGARSLTYARDGASRVYLERMFEQFGIAEELKPKTILEQGSAAANEQVAAGKAEFVLTLVSEILPAPGVALVGPLPAEVQNYVGFAAGISATAKDAVAARVLVRFLQSPEAAPVYRAKGMEPR